MVTNLTKNSSTASNLTKNSGSFSNQSRYVEAWLYNESGFTYNQAADPTTGQTVYYNGIGSQTWSNLTKS